MKILEVAIIVYYTESNKVLLQKRETIWQPDEDWGSFGWKIEEWESAKECLKREVKEELGYEENDLEYVWETFVNKDFENIIHLHLFASKLDANKLSKLKCIEWDWMELFNIDDAINLNFWKSIDNSWCNTMRLAKNFLENKIN